jgi:hypothetical protein
MTGCAGLAPEPRIRGARCGASSRETDCRRLSLLGDETMGLRDPRGPFFCGRRDWEGADKKSLQVYRISAIF